MVNLKRSFVIVWWLRTATYITMFMLLKITVLCKEIHFLHRKSDDLQQSNISWSCKQVKCWHNGWGDDCWLASILFYFNVCFKEYYAIYSTTRSTENHESWCQTYLVWYPILKNSVYFLHLNVADFLHVFTKGSSFGFQKWI